MRGRAVLRKGPFFEERINLAVSEFSSFGGFPRGLFLSRRRQMFLPEMEIFSKRACSFPRCKRWRENSDRFMTRDPPLPLFCSFYRLNRGLFFFFFPPAVTGSPWNRRLRDDCPRPRPLPFAHRTRRGFAKNPHRFPGRL